MSGNLKNEPGLAFTRRISESLSMQSALCATHKEPMISLWAAAVKSGCQGLPIL